MDKIKISEEYSAWMREKGLSKERINTAFYEATIDFIHEKQVTLGLPSVSQQRDLFEIIADRLEDKLPFELDGISRETLLKIISNSG